MVRSCHCNAASSSAYCYGGQPALRCPASTFLVTGGIIAVDVQCSSPSSCSGASTWSSASIDSLFVGEPSAAQVAHIAFSGGNSIVCIALKQAYIRRWLHVAGHHHDQNALQHSNISHVMASTAMAIDMPWTEQFSCKWVCIVWGCALACTTECGTIFTLQSWRTQVHSIGMFLHC